MQLMGNSGVSGRIQGVTLVEMLVGLTIGLLIILAATATYVSTGVTGTATLNSARLNTELRMTMDVMVDEIRRAGYSAVGGAANPFTLLLDVSGTNGECIEFTYDADSDGALSADEYFGFRIDGGAVLMRNGGTVLAADCASGDWEGLTNPDTVTILQHSNGQGFFVLTHQCLNSKTGEAVAGPCEPGTSFYIAAAPVAPVDLLETRSVSLNVGGQLVNDGDMQMELSQQVLVRNHRVVTVPAP